MKINWKVRLKNKAWWISITSQLIVVVGLVINGGHSMGFWSFSWDKAFNDWVMSVITSLLVLLSTIGILIDPTTPGLNDDENK
jgi:phi LC3 family holin